MARPGRKFKKKKPRRPVESEAQTAARLGVTKAEVRRYRAEQLTVSMMSRRLLRRRS